LITKENPVHASTLAMVHGINLTADKRTVKYE